MGVTFSFFFFFREAAFVLSTVYLFGREGRLFEGEVTGKGEMARMVVEGRSRREVVDYQYSRYWKRRRG